MTKIFSRLGKRGFPGDLQMDSNIHEGSKGSEEFCPAPNGGTPRLPPPPVLPPALKLLRDEPARQDGAFRLDQDPHGRRTFGGRDGGRERPDRFPIRGVSFATFVTFC